jgi:hypothetical protein
MSVMYILPCIIGQERCCSRHPAGSVRSGDGPFRLVVQGGCMALGGGGCGLACMMTPSFAGSPRPPGRAAPRL